MGMKETPKSLQTYFMAAGLAAMLEVGEVIRAGRGNRITIVLGVVCAIMYGYLSVCTSELLKKSPKTITRILLASSILLATDLLANLLVGNAANVTVCIVGLLINWYLSRNTNRLALEDKAAAGQGHA
jgi:ABC-type sulfate transport system permease component